LFNWLSAARDEASAFHNHEATLLVRGGAAGPLVQQFYNSPIGQKILLNQAQSTPVQVTNDLCSYQSSGFEHPKRTLLACPEDPGINFKPLTSGCHLFTHLQSIP